MIVAAANLLSILSNPTFDTGSIIIKVPRNLTSVGYLILHRFIKISFSETTGISDTDIDVANSNEIRKLREETFIETGLEVANILEVPLWRSPTIAPSVSPLPTLALSATPMPPTILSPTSKPASPVISWHAPSQEPTLVSQEPTLVSPPEISWRVPSQEPTLVSPRPVISWRIPTSHPTQSEGPTNSWQQPTPSPTFIAELHYVAKTFLITIWPSGTIVY
jgi:hypothetical protein